METVLVVGATGNIGVSAVTAVLNSKRNVLAIVRNQNSAEKLIKYIGSDTGITFVVADVTSETGVKCVVDQVQAGELPAFQHVYTCVGGEYTTAPLKDITTERLRKNMNISFEANFFAYRDTITYLQSQPNPTTFSICTGSQGVIGTHPLPAMTQGPLFSMAIAAARENEKTNVRFNEIFLAFRVEVDDSATKTGAVKATEFAKVYQLLLNDEKIRCARVRVEKEEDLAVLRWANLF